MKKVAFSVFFVSMLMAVGVAFADEAPTVLTTKDYVDAGLRYVYGVKADKEDVYTKDEADEIFLTSADIADLDTDPYEGKNGIKVEGHDVKLNVAPSEGAMYIYTSDGWAELEVQDEWGADVVVP